MNINSINTDTIYLPNEMWDIIMKYLNIEKQIQNLQKISDILDLKEKILEQQQHELLERTIELNEKEVELHEKSKALDVINNKIDHHLIVISKMLNELIDEDKEKLKH